MSVPTATSLMFPERFDIEIEALLQFIETHLVLKH